MEKVLSTAQRLPLLGVNIDHVATIRQARKTKYPDPIIAAAMAEEAGADGITIHLREDLRHIQKRDVLLLKDTLLTPMNLEIAATDAMVGFACKIKPHAVCIVPEKRQELTTEGGLDLIKDHNNLSKQITRLQDAGISVSLFINPHLQQIDTAAALNANAIEIHTGHYADVTDSEKKQKALEQINAMVKYGLDRQLIVNAGHGLNYHNIQPIAAIKGLHELNIGHAIIARALLSGLKQAVMDMKNLIHQAKPDVKYMPIY